MKRKDLKKFIGGLNADDNPSQLPDGDYVDALNVRTGSSDEQHGEGNLETLQGEVELLLGVAANITYYGEAIGGNFIYEGYEEIAIGTQVWMKKNWDVAYPGSKVYDNNEDNADIYGRLYTHNQIMSSDFCPSGWRVPTEADIDILLTYLGGEMLAGGKMKEVGTDHWTTPNTDADDSSAFTAIPGGKFDLLFDLIGENSLLWLQDEAEPIAPVAINGSEITAITFKANWLAVIGASGYYLDVAEDEDFTTFVAGYEDLDVGNVLTYSVSGLDGNTEYFYRVRAYNEIGASVSSNTISITTIIAIYIVTSINGTFSIKLAGTGSVTIKWDDWNIDTEILTGTLTEFTHAYTSGGVVTISNVENITQIEKRSDITVSQIIIPAEAINLTSIDLFALSAITEFETHDTWTLLEYLYVNDCTLLTAIDTYATWINLKKLLIYSTGITACETFATWVDLTHLQLDNNPGFLHIDTFPEWVNITLIHAYNTSIAIFDTYDTWVLLEQINVSYNNLASLVIHDSWVNIVSVVANVNAIVDAAIINAILIEADNIPGLDYQTFALEGGTNAAPTGAGITAKNNLIAKGCAVTTN